VGYRRVSGNKSFGTINPYPNLIFATLLASGLCKSSAGALGPMIPMRRKLGRISAAGVGYRRVSGNKSFGTINPYPNLIFATLLASGLCKSSAGALGPMIPMRRKLVYIPQPCDISADLDFLTYCAIYGYCKEFILDLNLNLKNNSKYRRSKGPKILSDRNDRVDSISPMCTKGKA
jgi:hypothetical protein